MKKNFKICAVLLASISIGTVFAGCGSDLPPSATIDTQYEWLSGEYTDSSQLSSWDDDCKLNLVAWNSNQTGGFKKYTSSNDIVYSEINRITGVSIDTENSFDNAGKSADVAYKDIVLTGLPDIAYGTSLVDPDAVYDLTELIDEYCPTIKARMPASVWKSSAVNGGRSGKVYGIPYGLGSISLSAVDEKADPYKSAMFEYNYDYYPYIYVREDILKDAYPSAYTTADLENIFAENGEFTEEQLFDIPITSAEYFRETFIPNIYNAIHANTKYKINSERWVEPMLVGSGSDRDTWDFVGVLLPMLLGGTGSFYNYGLSYWDKQDQEIKLMFEQEWFKAELKEWVKMISDGKYVDDYGLLNYNSTIQSELNRGYYAIAYNPNCRPISDTVTLDNGDIVNYRKVYMKIPQNEHVEYFVKSTPAVSSICIFKDSVRESDLPQILRWLDFQCSELCDKLVAWGPESAGLYTETTDENGEIVRRFKSEELAYQMVYSTATLGKEVQKYNLSNGAIGSANPVFTFFFAGGSKVHPKCTYDISSMSGLMSSYYSSAKVNADIPKIYVGIGASLSGWNDSYLEGIEALWAKRPTFEQAMKQVLASGNQFETKYSEMIKTKNRIGWTADFFAGEFTEAYLNLNEDYLENFYKG